MRASLLFFCLLPLLVQGQDKVGINTQTPQSNLDVRGIDDVLDGGELQLATPSETNFLRFFSGRLGDPNPFIAFYEMDTFHIVSTSEDWSTYTRRMTISGDGDVGIGITNPEARIDIRGGDWNLEAGNPGDLRIGSSSANAFRIGVAIGGGGVGTTRMYSQGGDLLLGVNNNSHLKITTAGRVLIGNVPAPAGKLDVRAETDIIAIKGKADISHGTGVFGEAASNSGFSYGVYGIANSIDGAGVFGEGPKTGVRGESPGLYGVYGEASGTSGINYGVCGYSASTTGSGVYGLTTAAGVNYGVRGTVYSIDGAGVFGEGPKTGVRGETSGLYGVYGEATGTSGVNYGVCGVSNSSAGNGVLGIITVAGTNYGVHGVAYSNQGTGVYGETSGESGKGLYGRATGVYGKGIHTVVTSTHSSANAILAESGGGSSYAGYFIGKLHVAGALSKSSGSFKIDHPLDPENKYLYHSFVESPDMMNVYNGNIRTNENGDATVTLPDYFEALNTDFKYQLTVIGVFSQAIISAELQNNTFSIKTDQPDVKVSWQVTGVRKDPYAESNRIETEVEKEPENKGKFLNPEAYGRSDADRIGSLPRS